MAVVEQQTAPTVIIMNLSFKRAEEEVLSVFVPNTLKNKNEKGFQISG